MIAHKLNALDTSKDVSINEEEEFSIPLDITDIISICKEYNKLGWNIQNQVEYIIECGVEDSIKNNLISQEALPYILNFLQQITKNPYFGDSTFQSNEIIKEIKKYIQNFKQKKNKIYN